jgi:hypothetical protein
MLDDYEVPSRSREYIQADARACRRMAGIGRNTWKFNIVDYIEQCLTPNYTEKGRLSLEVRDLFLANKPAMVLYQPLRLRVNPATWGLARHEDPDANFILAHEIGHIRLHDHHAKPFSGVKGARLRDDISAECQANLFASHFLLDDEVIHQSENADQIAEICNLPIWLAEERWEEQVERRLRKRRAEQLGDFCGQCLNFSLQRENGRLICQNCR